MRKLKITHAEIPYIEMTIQIDDEKFKKVAKGMNESADNSKERVEAFGSHENAVIATIAAHCFEIVAFNNEKDKSYVTEQLNILTDGLPKLSRIGIEILQIKSWFVGVDGIVIKEI